MAMDDFGPIAQDMLARIYTDATDRAERMESGEINAWQALNDQTMQIADALTRAIAALEAKVMALEDAVSGQG